jgi:hypothetical protein
MSFLRQLRYLLKDVIKSRNPLRVARYCFLSKYPEILPNFKLKYNFLMFFCNMSLGNCKASYPRKQQSPLSQPWDLRALQT